MLMRFSLLHVVSRFAMCNGDDHALAGSPLRRITEDQAFALESSLRSREVSVEGGDGKIFRLP